LGNGVTQNSAGNYRVELVFEFKTREPNAVFKKGFTNKLKPSVNYDIFCHGLSTHNQA